MNVRLATEVRPSQNWWWGGGWPDAHVAIARRLNMLGVMTTWTHPPRLALLEQTLAIARDDPQSVSDEDLIAQVRATYWGTNCWSWVEMSLAIISAACALRPQLADDLIADPIDVMIQGGLDNEDDVIAQGVALARKSDPYVPLSEAGRAWLEESWPLLEQQARVIFRRKWIELNE